MRRLSGHEIRQTFLRFFEERGHTVVPSSSLVPGNDPTLLFTNAGMVQFKDVFLGLETRPYTRATSCQRCVRAGGKHNDLEEVGPSPRHHTFFEMLGNFSFGDYFKREAIAYAWELLTEVFELPKERLWVTIFREEEEEDREAFELWQEIAGLPPERIVGLGRKDNFWEMGETGPCGPCSEIVFDRGEEHRCDAPVCAIGACDCDRWLELWNLVFMQYNRREDGTLEPLPKPSVDTGMGLERIASVLQGSPDNYHTDLFLPILRRIQELLGHSDEEREARLARYRAVADHARAATFLIADGVLPSNEGRGYVLRRILRRAVYQGKLLGFEDPFLWQAAEAVIETMLPAYPYLEARRPLILEAIREEERRFQETLDTGLALLEEALEGLEGRVIPGEVAFRLYDTYGFPLDLTRRIAWERGLSVDEEGFGRALDAQRARSRAATAEAFRLDVERLTHLYGDLPKTRFTGYTRMDGEGRVLRLVRDGSETEVLRAGEEGEAVLDETPFYAEGGGQVGDTGVWTWKGGRARVLDTQAPVPGVHVHRIRVEEGELRVGERVRAQVDVARRWDIMRHHTTTHLLHRALRQVLGEHAAQAGSLVAPDRLRFDFSHLRPLTPEQLRQVEDLVNEAIRADLPVRWEILPYREALARGAIALFGEKYGDRVRVVQIGEEAVLSAELCGGTHLERTGQAGFFKIVSEGSVGAGVRRIEAVAGRAAEAYVRRLEAALREAAELLGTPPEGVRERLQTLLEEREALKRELAELRRAQEQDLARTLAEGAEPLPWGGQLVRAVVPDLDAEGLRTLADRLRERLGSAVVLLGTVQKGRPLLIAAATPDQVQRGIHAGELVRVAGKEMGGGGGGRPNLAQAGGRDPERLEAALEAAVQKLRAQVSSQAS